MERIDSIITKQGLTKSRTAAALLIKEGRVTVNGSVVKKNSEKFEKDVKIEIEYRKIDYVSRGGFKLQEALEHFKIDIKGLTAVDIGASTGGFTDCLLQRGINFVYAVDVGEGQLDERIKNNPKVASMPKTNARSLEKSALDKKIDLIVMDVSFISQTLLYPTVNKILDENGIFISLLKPQFEAGKSLIGKGGIIKDPMGKIFEEIMARIESAAKENNLTLLNHIPSPILGGDGNREYLMYFVKGGINEKCIDIPESNKK